MFACQHQTSSARSVGHSSKQCANSNTSEVALIGSFLITRSTKWRSNWPTAKIPSCAKKSPRSKRATASDASWLFVKFCARLLLVSRRPQNVFAPNTNGASPNLLTKFSAPAPCCGTTSPRVSPTPLLTQSWAAPQM